MLRTYARLVALLAAITLPVQALAAALGPCCAGLAGADVMLADAASAHDHHHPVPDSDPGQTACECAECVSGSLSVAHESPPERVCTNTRKLPVVYRSAVPDHIPGLPLRPPSL